jgi:ribose transport system ATP-binding protein/rhamnose transport system ATP-binding protein
MEDTKPILSVHNISKNFGGVRALSDVTFEVQRGECHAVVGENGAGKTTLINILNGAYISDTGYFEFDSVRYTRTTPEKMLDSGLAVIHQELALVETLSVMENIYLSSLGGKNGFFTRKRSELAASASEILDSLGCPIDPWANVETLSTSKRQLVEIAKALVFEPKLLVMDEPTAALTHSETEHLFSIIRKLKTRGISIIFISHRLNEVFAISDKVTALRDGKYVGTVDTADVVIPDVVKMMVGREIELYEKQSTSESKRKEILRIEGLTKKPHFEGISFGCMTGEVLCFSGLVGSGRSELMQTIFGFLKKDSGTIFLNGTEVSLASPPEAMKNGIAFLPEDRKIAAAISTMNVRENMSIAVLPTKLTNLLVVNRKKEKSLVKEYIQSLSIKTDSMENPITTLSGGNQQKVILARWLAMGGKILIVDEPTQGVDVGAKAEIHRILRGLAQEGIAVVVVSSDLPEVLSLADRIIVMRGGTIAGELNADDATEEAVMELATVQAC